MDKKEALQDIIYNLKEIEGTRLRLSASKPEVVDLELALLNQQVVNLYQRLQSYQSGLYISRPAEPQPKKETPNIEYHIKEEIKEPVKSDPITYKQPEIQKEKEPETELKRDGKDAQLRKERLKRLEAEAAKAEAARKTEPAPAPKGEVVDFTDIVQQKYVEDDIKKEAEKVSGIVSEQHHHKSASDLTLNEKLQSAKKLPESLNEKLSAGDSKKTLAEKMKLGPISDLKSAMALNQKIAFTNGLFKGDDKEFKKALNFLNNCRNFSEAKIYLQTEIGSIYGWDDNDPLVEEFTELVYRKFL